MITNKKIEIITLCTITSKVNTYRLGGQNVSKYKRYKRF